VRVRTQGMFVMLAPHLYSLALIPKTAMCAQLTIADAGLL